MRPGDFKFITDFVKVNYTDSYTTNFDISTFNISGNNNNLTLTTTKLNDKQLLINFKGTFAASTYGKIMSVFPKNYTGQFRIDLVNINNPDWLNSNYKIVDWSTNLSGDSGCLDVTSCYQQMDLNAAAAGESASVFGEQFNLLIFNDNIKDDSKVDITFKLTCSEAVRVLIKDNQKVSNYTFKDKKFLVMLLNDLQKATTKHILTIGSANLAKLTDEEKKIATDKGWTLA